MISLLIVLSIIYIIALFIHIISKQKIEIALFEVICSIVILLTIAGLFSIMHIMQIAIYIITGISLILTLYIVILKKKVLNLEEIITPAVVMAVIFILFYYLSVRNNVFHIKDEVTAYGISVKRMLYTNAIDHYGSIPTFAYFINKLTGYSEGMVFTSKWIFFWISLSVPISNIRWKNWYLVLIYCLIGFGVITIINPEPMFMMDEAVGLMAGVLCAYLCVNLKDSNPLVLGMGLIVLIITKDMAGILFGLFVLLFILVNYFIIFTESKYKLSKPLLINLLVIAFSMGISIILSTKTVGIPYIINKVFTSYKFILVILSALVIFAGSTILYRKMLSRYIGKKVMVSVGIVSLIIVCAIIYKTTWAIILSFNYKHQIDFTYSLSKYFGYGYFNIRLVSLMGLMAIFLVGISLIALQKQYIKYAVAQFTVMIVLLFLYGYIIAYIFTTQYDYMISNMNGLERYLGSMIIMVCLWLMGFVFSANYFWQNKIKQFFCICLVSSLFIKSYPTYGETMFNIYDVSTISFKEGIRAYAKDQSDKIGKYTPADAKILFINQNTGENFSNAGIEYWIIYNLVPRSLGSRLSSFTTDETFANNDYMTQFCTKEDFKNLILMNDYVYLITTDSQFWNNYGEYFQEIVLDDGGTLFKVNSDGEPMLKRVIMN